MILFLDFDGVCHPWRRSVAQEFCYLPRIEAVLRDFPLARVVISSDWRLMTPWHLLVSPFASDIRPRVIGTAPDIGLPEDLTGHRHTEAIAFLAERNLTGIDWVALDDVAHNWRVDEPRLILCEDGFHEREQQLLREALAAASPA